MKQSSAYFLENENSLDENENMEDFNFQLRLLRLYT
jgi:hypothetical protein